jgi:hypothetical protein
VVFVAFVVKIFSFQENETTKKRRTRSTGQREKAEQHWTDLSSFVVFVAFVVKIFFLKAIAESVLQSGRSRKSEGVQP